MISGIQAGFINQRQIIGIANILVSDGSVNPEVSFIGRLTSRPKRLRSSKNRLSENNGLAGLTSGCRDSGIR